MRNFFYSIRQNAHYRYKILIIMHRNFDKFISLLVAHGARARVRKVNVPTVIALPSSLDKYSIFDLSEC